MTRFTIASFNVKNLIGPDQWFYDFQRYTPEEYAWKLDWIAEQLQTMNADIVAFQEIFDQDSLRAAIAQADAEGIAGNEVSQPDESKRYRRKAIFAKIAYDPYSDAALAIAPNANDRPPDWRSPGLAILSRFGFTEPPQVLQDLAEPVEVDFAGMGGAGGGGHYTLKRLSRPILKARVPVGDTVVTVFNCHLKSKLGEYIRPAHDEFAPEENLLEYDAVGRAMGAMRAGLRRMAEAWVLRREIVKELEAGHPVLALGDFNDDQHAVSSEIISGEVPFHNYAWMLRHDAKGPSDRYTDQEDTIIYEEIEAVRLHSAQAQLARRSLRDMVYTTAFGGTFQSIDQIFMSRHFLREWPEAIGEMEYFSVFNDHLTDGSHPEAPYNKLASDHGQIMAHMKMKE